MSASVHISVQLEPFDQAAEEANIKALGGDIGAIVSFTGLVRSEGGALTALTLEHYPAMTKTELGRIVSIACERWDIAAVTVIHRFGRLVPGNPIVLVIAASNHRRAAFQAADFIMDYLKTDAPFWKKQEATSGECEWVQAKESDIADKARWSQ